jgi:hypothetical protein
LAAPIVAEHMPKDLTQPRWSGGSGGAHAVRT